MPIGQKTRRHGRNLRKLDGLERRHRKTRRRVRVQQQVGGANTVVDSLDAWIKAVTESPAWRRTDAQFESPTYRIKALAADAPTFAGFKAIPLATTNAPGNTFAITEGLLQYNIRDVRQLAGYVKLILKYIITDDMTAREFESTMKSYRIDYDNRARVEFLDAIETAIRRSADADFTGSVVIDENRMVSTGDSSRKELYPLFIWYLFYSKLDDDTSLEDEVEPVLDETAPGRAPAEVKQGAPAVPE
jgi:hypothetical protein